MGRIPNWQKKRIKRAVLAELEEIFQNNKSMLNSIQEAIASLVVTQDEKHQQHVIVLLLVAILQGFDSKKDALGTLELARETLDAYMD